ncbi:50S ribosomal protein L10 [candidate division Kazan bacterium RIFCSPHIGHO2_01_FULL_44_14]|uniref:Large ribosomal subunit protein uL10 n=1 Tax=candidate division Kazan bacterium RIFCSPLOWO2_01_FULL_45_19 TaxID=1798538 RepID=A0A1F4NQM6_UNCK3|nr:MAG: 50S ribosomal protein L10 [candidate division Kazan bacterium RIFCSPLOWO2_01_FULL_45_19]OGB78018.1 MAG: 50S ribosomal protein L10 [candidate division Kazan bacterium RIFCSPHIGHO2_01_FULL_44_14]
MTDGRKTNMPKSKAQKGAVIDKLTSELKATEFGVLTDFTGLTMPDLDTFRKKAREQSVKYTAVKASLFDIAAKNAGLTGMPIVKTGKSYAFASGGQDEVSIAKLVYEMAKKSDNRVHIASGVVHGEVISGAMVMQLAQLPSREELLSRVVGSMNAPISNFVYGLNYNLQSFYNVIKAIAVK